jgi:hypothetical protein
MMHHHSSIEEMVKDFMEVDLGFKRTEYSLDWKYKECGGQVSVKVQSDDDLRRRLSEHMTEFNMDRSGECEFRLWKD